MRGKQVFPRLLEYPSAKRHQGPRGPWGDAHTVMGSADTEQLEPELLKKLNGARG